MHRSPRLPLKQSEFDRLEMPLFEMDPLCWVNLRFAEFASENGLFYPNPGARLTPFSLKVPCLYLAQTEKTAFLELYGDKLYLARQSGGQMILPEEELNRRVYIRIQTKPLRLCDLVRKGSGAKLHLDAGTLWASDFEYPQRFAEAIHGHPAGVDGIRYQSRHTDEICIVVWQRGLDVAHLEKTPPASLRSHISATDIRTIRLFGEEMTLAGTRKTFDELTRD